MITFPEALGKAINKNNKYDYYIEYEKLYVFCIKDAPEAIGGPDSPAVIDKETGEFTTYPMLLKDGHYNWLDDVVREGTIEERMAELRPIGPTHHVRYYFEHRFIPQQLYEHGIAFMNAIVNEDNILNKMFHGMIKEEGIDDPYPEIAVIIEPFRIENILCAAIKLPEPEEEPLCYEVYALFNIDTKEAAYYCLEKGGYINDQPFLCGWSKEGSHLNYGNCTFDRDELLKDMLKLLLNPNGKETLRIQALYSPKKDEEQ